MSRFKTKLFTKLVLSAKEYNSKHKKHAKNITFITLGIIVLLSIILYIPEKIVLLLSKLFKLIFTKKGITVVAGIAILCVAVFAFKSGFLVPGSKEKESSLDIEVTTDDVNEAAIEDSNSSQTEADLKTEDTTQTEVESEENVAADTADSETSVIEASNGEDNVEASNDDTSNTENTKVDTSKEDAAEVEDKSTTVKNSSADNNENSGDNKLYAMDEFMESLEKEYPEAIGWVYFEDGSISYPIMQSDDNEKYLTIGYDGNPADTGAIFLDCRSAADFSDPNSIVYGHNMKNQTMFGSLRNYRNDPTYYDSHQYFYIITKDSFQKYEVFAYMDVPTDYILYNYVGEKSLDFVRDAEPVRLKSYMDSELPVNEDKKVVTLSTCTSKDTLRFVVLGVSVD